MIASSSTTTSVEEVVSMDFQPKDSKHYESISLSFSRNLQSESITDDEAQTPVSSPNESSDVVRRNNCPDDEAFSQNKNSNSGGGALVAIEDFDLVEDTDISEIFSEGPLTAEAFDALTANKLPLCYDVSQIVGQKFGQIRILDTKAHREIFSVLIEQTANLSQGKYVGQEGTCSSTMVGAKGIGKSSSLRHLTKLLKYIYPDVIAVYVTFNSMKSVDSPHHSETLSQLIDFELNKHGVVSVSKEKMKGCSSLRIAQGLVNSKKKLLLLVDELDELYRYGGDHAISTLSDLSAFGSQRSGAVSVVLCGSSALMESLITANNSNEAIRHEFPLLTKGAPNINSTKYRTKRVYSTLPTDLDSVASIVGVDTLDPTQVQATKQYCRLLAFLTGCTARNVQRIINEVKGGSLVRGSMSPENSLAGGNTMSIDAIRSLRELIMRALLNKNTTLVDELFGDGTLGYEQVAKNIACVEWETKFQPIEYGEVELLWNQEMKNHTDSAYQNFDVMYGVLHLADRLCIAVAGVQNSKPCKIYPSSLAILMREVLKNESQSQGITDKVKEFLKGGIQAVKKISKNPTVARVSQGSK